MKETFAGRVRKAAMEVQAAKGNVALDALQAACPVRNRKESDLVHQTVWDFCRRGEMRRLKSGIYLYTGRKKSAQKQQIMWRYLCSGRSFGGVTVDELQEVAEACEGYVREWLGSLVALGVLKGIKGRWRLTVDPTEMPPENEAKAERLRGVRAKKKQAVYTATSTTEKEDEASRLPGACHGQKE
jgi:hypothetical protein